MKIRSILLLLISAAAALLTPARAQLPIATTSSQEVIPRAGAGPADYGVRSSMKMHPITGHPGIAHFDRTARQLIYSAWNGAAWEDLAIHTYNNTAGDDLFYCSLAYSPAGIPSIAYFDRDAFDLKFARLNATGTGWVTETVDTNFFVAGTVGRFCSLAYAPDGKAYVSYYHDVLDEDFQPASQDLKVATRSTSGVWSLASVDSGGNVGQWTSLAIDPVGLPAVSYYDVTNGDLVVTRQNGQNWSKAIVDSVGDTGTFTSLAFDASSVPFIAYRGHNGYLRLLSPVRTSGTSTLWNVDSAVQCYDISLTIDRQGQAVVTYYDATNGDLRLATGAGTQWHLSTVETAGTTGVWSSLAIGPDGMASVCYRAGLPQGQLKYARLTGWAVQTVTTGNQQAGEYTSLSFSPDGRPAISYYEPSSRQLRFTQQEASGTWSDGFTYSEFGVGTHTSQGFGPDGKPGISFNTVSSPGVAFATPAAAGFWDVDYLDTAPAGGTTTSLSYGPDGAPAICYENGSKVIKFARRKPDRTWEYQTVSSDFRVDGWDSSLSHGPDGRPAVAYGGGVLKFAERTADGRWMAQTIDTGDVGFDVSLSFGPGGRPAISHRGRTTGNLEYAERRADGSWITKTIDSGEVGESSLGHGPGGNPAISYVDSQFRQLKYAERAANGSWVVQIIDRFGYVGDYNSLSYGPDGRPAISYHDETNDDLKFARRIISLTAETTPFQIMGVTRDPSTKIVTLGWQGLPASTYQVDFSPTMAPGSWQIIGDNIKALDGMTFFRTTSLLGQSNPRAYFRVTRK